MKISDLKNIKERYSAFRTLLFNDDIPTVDNIDFIIHGIAGAVGYSRYRETPTKNGKQHVIAFSKYYAYNDKLAMEILIHEMIHLWQVYHVKADRYKICTHMIAHDRVFMSKMNTINLLLKRNMYDYEIHDVCTEDLLLDNRINSKKDFYVLFFKFKGENNKHFMMKVKEEHFENLKDKILNTPDCVDSFSEMYMLKTNSYIFNQLTFFKALNINACLTEAVVNKKDVFEMFKDNMTKIYTSNDNEV